MPLNETISNTTVQYTVTTTNTADGTVLYWKTTGNTTNSDIVGGNTGTITITNNRALLNVTVSADANTDGTKILGVSISTGSLTGPVAVNTASLIEVFDTSQTPTPYSLEYMVVAGGGGGGMSSGPGVSFGPGQGISGAGGGAGGLRTGTWTVIPTQTVITITVAAGGANSTPAAGFGVMGGNSAISATGFTTVTSTGGGGGGQGWPANNEVPGRPGGSGGGSTGGGTAGIGNTPPVTPSQGNPGGTVSNFPGWNIAGGGGGYGGAGGNGGNSGPTNGKGGPGYLYPYTGNYYAAGGTSGNYTGAVDGIGGYGNNPGVINTGSGGGGGTNSNGGAPNPGGRGAPGIVILVTPTLNYPGSAPGATVTTPPATPGKTVLTFTSSGTYTA